MVHALSVSTAKDAIRSCLNSLGDCQGLVRYCVQCVGLAVIDSSMCVPLKGLWRSLFERRRVLYQIHRKARFSSRWALQL